MQTVEETRRQRLQMLVEEHGGMANLCERLGTARNETATLTRILNGNVRHERGGKPYNMGSPTARDIEGKLGLPTGWMDTPPSITEMHGESAPLDKVAELFAHMNPDVQAQAVRILAALGQPKDGTNGAAH